VTTTTGRGIAVIGPKLIFTDNGQHCYCNSGTFPANTANAVMFNFQTGSDAIKGEFTFNGQIYYVSGSAGGHSVFRISFNDIVIGLYKVDTAQMDQPNQLIQKVIIPPLTTVLVECISGEVSAVELLTSTFRGRVV